MLSIAITSYNRSDLTIESFSKVFDHPLVSEICIVDDCSDLEHWVKLLELIDAHPATHKINVFRNEKNLGMSLNKAEAVRKAKNEWVVLLDSDNILEEGYIESLGDIMRHPEFGSVKSTVILCPDMAKPDYDFTELPDVISSKNAKNLLHLKEFRIFCNTCNYVVNRGKYLEVYKYDPSIQESDTIYFNTLWLQAGYSFYIVPNMRYYHRRHSGSGWLNGDQNYNLKKADELQEKIRNL